jgi:hypothetical protein
MPVTIGYEDGRIYFLKSPFALKDEIRAMQGSKWHGFQDPPKKYWSIADSFRNRFQLDFLKGGNPYENFDRPVIEHDFPKFGSERFGYHNLMAQQHVMANNLLTYHYGVWGAEMGCGKSLAAFAAMHLSGARDWWWVGPKSSLYGIRQELDKWGVDPDIITNLTHYEAFRTQMQRWKSGDPGPQGVIFDESQRLKNPSSQLSQAAMGLADAIRSEHGMKGYVLLMSGTPSPKSPADWWSSCEIAWPGFIKEGSKEAFEKRMGFFRIESNLSGQNYPRMVAWKDDSDRCDLCGHYFNEGHHTVQGGAILEDMDFELHEWRKSTNEVQELQLRLEGLVTIVHKKDCLELPNKIYKEVICEPTESIKRVAGVLTRTAPSVITGLIQLRALSDGFQYREIEDGYQDCKACEDGTIQKWYHPNDPEASVDDITLLDNEFVSELESHVVDCDICNGTTKMVKYKRISREVPCPKEDAIVDLLTENEEIGRIGIFAGFTGSLNRITRVCQREGWDTMRVDGRGWLIERLTGKPNKDGTQETETVKLNNPMDYWVNNPERKVAFAAHPKSGGVSLTLCPQEGRPGANMLVFYSNDFDPASRAQAEDRIHRVGMVGGAMIVDLFHLPTDRRVRDVLMQNRKLELLSMGDIENDYQ